MTSRCFNIAATARLRLPHSSSTHSTRREGRRNCPLRQQASRRHLRPRRQGAGDSDLRAFGKEPHIAVVLDSCHSGSGTRDLSSFPSVVRNTVGKFPPRPIESYLEGQYAAMAKTGPLNIPNGRHILLAACDRSQTAKEDSATHAGYFTTALYDVLRHSGPLTYPDLFVRARAAVRTRIRSTGDSDQDPQFEPVDGFDSYSGVFGAPGEPKSSNLSRQPGRRRLAH